MLQESDSEDELPSGWEERATLDGRVYYANHLDKSTQWTHPRTGKKKRVTEELPHGWERVVNEDGKVFYLETATQKKTFSDPRLAFCYEEKEDIKTVRQRFDGSSTALQVLHGIDLNGKVAIITGSNCGIGFNTAKALAWHGCHVVMACRDENKANDAIKLIMKSKGNAKLSFIKLDLGSFQSVQEFVLEFRKQFNILHILILNAGIFGTPYLRSVDNIELTFQVNYLSHFYLTLLLEDVLLKAKLWNPRVVILSSESHRFSTLDKFTLNMDTLSPSASQYSSMHAYNNSKLCCILFAKHLDYLWNPKGIFCNAVHPGNLVSSYLSRNWWPYKLLFAVVRPFTKSLDQASSTTIYCACSPDMESQGGYYLNNCCVCPPSASSENTELQRLLWDLSHGMIANALGPNAFSNVV